MNNLFFQKYLLPGFIFQSLIIGGGYGTGRELVEFFLTAGPLAGLVNGPSKLKIVRVPNCLRTFITCFIAE